MGDGTLLVSAKNLRCTQFSGSIEIFGPLGKRWGCGQVENKSNGRNLRVSWLTPEGPQPIVLVVPNGCDSFGLTSLELRNPDGTYYADVFPESQDPEVRDNFKYAVVMKGGEPFVSLHCNFSTLSFSATQVADGKVLGHAARRCGFDVDMIEIKIYRRADTAL